MRVEETEVYRAWINGLRYTAGRARIQVRGIDWYTATPASIAT